MYITGPYFFAWECIQPRKYSYMEDEPKHWNGIECGHSEHNPPNMIVIPEGKIYHHICPACGKESIIHSNWPTL